MRDNRLSAITLQLIDLLADKAPADKEQILEQYEIALSKNTSFREQLLKSGIIKDEDYQKALASIINIGFIDKIHTLPAEFQEKFTQTISIRFAKKFVFFPYKIADDELGLAVLSPWPTFPYEKAADALGFERYSMALSTENAIIAAINQDYDRSSGSTEEVVEVLGDDEDLNYLNHFSEETEDLLDAEDEEPIKKLMNSIIFQSVRDASSDIHIDPNIKETVVRNRIDGVLHEVAKVPKQAHVPLVNRVKVMASLDISTKNQPQDGRTMILLGGKTIDIRVSIIPTVYGEQAVMRLLNQSQGIISLKNLGMNGETAEQIEKLVNQPHGIVLVTGPTGSGKTTTLYSALNTVNAHKKNIVTIEDPVEYRIGSYGQMQVNEKIGVTFSKGLRSMLRQDPDVIMIGEMRDTETAKIAIQSSLTGHLVLSTLHTNDAPSTIIRMIDMGVEPYLLSSTVLAVLSQRLVRKICPKCKESYNISGKKLIELGIQDVEQINSLGKLWRGRGCAHCLNTGYQGRLGIFELLLMNDSVRQAINISSNASNLKHIAIQNGMKELKADGWEKVTKGVTTIEEIMRIALSDYT